MVIFGNSDMKEFVGLCYIGISREKTDYVILPFAEDISRGTSVLHAPVIPFAESKMAQEGCSFLTEHLRNRPKMDAAGIDSLPKPSKPELKKLNQTYRFCQITLLKVSGVQEEIKIMPLHAKRGWNFDVKAEEIRFYPLPMTNEKFVEALNAALKIAT